MAAEGSRKPIEIPARIKIKVVAVGEDAEDWYFALKITTQFKNLFTEYHRVKKKPLSYYTFLYDGKKLDANQTPWEVGMDAEHPYDLDDEEGVITVRATHEVHGGGNN